jgi:hypothetical protein
MLLLFATCQPQCPAEHDARLVEYTPAMRWKGVLILSFLSASVLCTAIGRRRRTYALGEAAFSKPGRLVCRSV